MCKCYKNLKWNCRIRTLKKLKENIIIPIEKRTAVDFYKLINEKQQSFMKKVRYD